MAEKYEIVAASPSVREVGTDPFRIVLAFWPSRTKFTSGKLFQGERGEYFDNNDWFGTLEADYHKAVGTWLGKCATVFATINPGYVERTFLSRDLFKQEKEGGCGA